MIAGDSIKSVMVVDDHPLFREGLKTIVESSEKYEVVAEAGRVSDAIMIACECTPDIILVDISMPGRSGIQFLRDVRHYLPETKFIIVSMHANTDYIVEAFRAGATGYMVKDSPGDGLLEGLAVVERGDVYIDNSLPGEVLDKLLSSGDSATSSESLHKPLSSREQEVMRLLAEGSTTREVAKRLDISPKTVENHRANLMKKLGLSGTIEMVRHAAKLGLIDISSWVQKRNYNA